MWGHFFRQLFGWSVGGPFPDVRINLIDRGTYRVELNGRDVRLGIHTELIDNDRVSYILSQSFTTWSDGTALSAAEKAKVLDAAEYWLRTQGNSAHIV
jgi:hypothetical protein